MELRIKEKISINETKAELERIFDITKLVFEPPVDEDKMKKSNQMVQK